MAEIITESTLLLFLALAGWIDRKNLMLPIALIAAGALAGVLVNILTRQKSFLDMAAGTGIGLVMLLIGYASRQALGYGDGLLMAAAGVYLGGTETIVLLLCSLLVAAITSIALLAAKKKNRKDRIAFASFVLAGFVLMKAIW